MRYDFGDEASVLGFGRRELLVEHEHLVGPTLAHDFGEEVGGATLGCLTDLHERRVECGPKYKRARCEKYSKLWIKCQE